MAEFGICDTCGQSARVSKERRVLRHRHHNGKRLDGLLCAGVGDIPAVIWVRPGEYLIALQDTGEA